MHSFTISHINTDEIIDNQTAITNAYAKISHAECLIDCLISLGNTLSSCDYKVQFIELADILHAAQLDLMRSELWDASMPAYETFEESETHEVIHRQEHSDLQEHSDMQEDAAFFNEVFDQEAYDEIKKVVEKELPWLKRKR